MFEIGTEINKNSVCSSETAAHNFCNDNNETLVVLLRTIFQLFLQAVLL